MHTHVPTSPPSWASLPSSFSHPSRSSQSTKPISLCYAAASHQPTILHSVVYICRCYSHYAPALPPHLMSSSPFSMSISLLGDLFLNQALQVILMPMVFCHNLRNTALTLQNLTFHPEPSLIPALLKGSWTSSTHWGSCIFNPLSSDPRLQVHLTLCHTERNGYLVSAGGWVLPPNSNSELMVTTYWDRLSPLGSYESEHPFQSWKWLAKQNSLWNIVFLHNKEMNMHLLKLGPLL